MEGDLVVRVGAVAAGRREGDAQLHHRTVDDEPLDRDPGLAAVEAAVEVGVGHGRLDDAAAVPRGHDLAVELRGRRR